MQTENDSSMLFYALLQTTTLTLTLNLDIVGEGGGGFRSVSGFRLRGHVDICYDAERTNGIKCIPTRLVMGKLLDTVGYNVEAYSYSLWTGMIMLY